MTVGSLKRATHCGSSVFSRAGYDVLVHVSQSFEKVHDVLSMVQELQGGQDECGTVERPSAPLKKLSKITINNGAAVIQDDSRLTVRQLASIVDISIRSMHQLLMKDLGLCTLDSKIAQMSKRRIKLLSTNNCEGRSGSTLYIDNVITADETWISMCDLEKKQQSTQWVEKEGPPPKKAREKSMIITFFYKEGIIYNHVIPNC